MLRTLVVAASLGLSSLVVSAQQPDPSLQVAFDRLAAAWASHDTATWDRLVDANFMIQHADGRVHVKPDELEHIRSGDSTLSPRIGSDDDVSLLGAGKAAVRHYTAESGRVTELWTHHDGSWRLVSHFEGFGHRPVYTGIVHV